jgi:hypothetical protein
MMPYYDQIYQPETNNNYQSITQLNRDNLALFHNQFKLNNLHNIGRNTIRNYKDMYSVNQDMYSVNQPAGDRYNYTNYDRVSENTINLNFAKPDNQQIQNKFDIVKMGQFRLFTNKGINRGQVLNLINLINKYGAKRVGYTIMGDSIIPSNLNYQDRFTLASLPADYE